MYCAFTFNNFSLCLSSVGDFLNTGAKGPTSVKILVVVRFTILFTRAKGDAVWTYGLSDSHGNLSMAEFSFQ